MARDTGLPETDAEFDFNRQRRRRALARLTSRLRRGTDVSPVLPFEEVVQALGRRGERRLGVQTIELDSIVGSVDRPREFDRSFRPTSARIRPRWQRLAVAMRRGQEVPPIDVYRIGEVHFVRDGHHRVSVARALGYRDIDARVTEVLTVVGADRRITLADLPLKSHERLFRERVPLPESSMARIELSDEWRYAGLAEGVEAWGLRAMQARRELMTREQVAGAWFREEYEPVVAALREAELIGSGTETEAYMRLAALRYLVLRTHEWSEDVIERLREEIRRPTWDEDTLVRQLRKEQR